MPTTYLTKKDIRSKNIEDCVKELAPFVGNNEKSKIKDKISKKLINYMLEYEIADYISPNVELKIIEHEKGHMFLIINLKE